MSRTDFQDQNATQLIQAILRDRFRAEGFQDMITNEPALWTQGGNYIVEILFPDPGRQPILERLLKSIQSELSLKGIGLNVLLRALWKVDTVEYVGPARSQSGGLKTALRFSGNLSSGVETRRVTADLSISALDAVREKLQFNQVLGYIGWSPQKGDIPEVLLEAIVRIFLTALFNGEISSDTDPLRTDFVDIRRSDIELLLGSGTAFSELKNALDDAVSLGLSNALSPAPTSFDEFLPELINFMGGAFKPGQSFVTSSTELYNQLRPSEQQLLRAYFDFRTSV
jgi:hypothetical protein